MTAKRRWLNELSRQRENEIEVKFLNGQTVIYTREIFGMLASDPEVEWITDEETGELLYWKEVA